MAAPQKGTVRSLRKHRLGLIRASIDVKGRETPIYVEVPMRMGLKIGDKVEVRTAPRGSEAKQKIAYKVKKI